MDDNRLIFGISSGHDASVSVCSLQNKVLNVEFAVASERVDRKKHSTDIVPALKAAMRYVESRSDLSPLLYKAQACVEVVFSQKTLLENLRRSWYGSEQLPTAWTVEREFCKAYPQIQVKTSYANHHESHAAFAYYSVPHSVRYVLVADGAGGFNSVSVWEMTARGLKTILRETLPFSLGLMYSRLSEIHGFPGEEGSFMALAALSENNTQFPSWSGNEYGSRLVRSFVLPDPENFPSDSKRASLLAQEYIESYLTQLVDKVQNKYGEGPMAAGGGVFLNCLLNGKLRSKLGSKNFHVSTNPGDSGNAVGCVLAKAPKQKWHVRWAGKNHSTPFLGREVKPLQSSEEVALLLSQGFAVGLLHGREEFGPRALGNRSLLVAPPVNNRMFPIRKADGLHKDDRSFQDNLKNLLAEINLLKGRESFRPVAPSMQRLSANKYLFWSDIDDAMLMQYAVKPMWMNSTLPVHGSNWRSSVRLHVATEGSFFESLLHMLEVKYGIGYVLNTSLNAKGQPLLDYSYSSDGNAFLQRAKNSSLRVKLVTA